MKGKFYYNLRPEFERGALLESEVLPNALEQLMQWVDEAVALPELMPTAMTLATSTFEGKPSARVVLLERIDEAGIYFFTNYESKKGKQLLQHPQAAAVLFWPQLERQVRIEGFVQRADDELNDEYFTNQSVDHQINAWSFPQSQVVSSRKYLEMLVNDNKEDFLDREIPRPTNWGGYCLSPQLVEFWQGRPNHMHDRLQYTLFNGEWQIERLAP